MLEADIEEHLRKEVRRVGGYAFKWVPTIAGVPDRMVLMPNGIARFVELKQKGLKPEKIQAIWHDRLRAIGFEVVVLDSKVSVDEWVAEIANL